MVGQFSIYLGYNVGVALAYKTGESLFILKEINFLYTQFRQCPHHLSFLFSRSFINVSMINAATICVGLQLTRIGQRFKGPLNVDFSQCSHVSLQRCLELKVQLIVTSESSNIPLSRSSITSLQLRTAVEIQALFCCILKSMSSVYQKYLDFPNKYDQKKAL